MQIHPLKCFKNHLGSIGGGVPAGTDRSGNEYWAPAATIFPRIEASRIPNERRFCPPLLRPYLQLPAHGMDGRVPASSYGSGNESSAPVATIFPRTKGSRVCSKIASLSGEEDAEDRGYMGKGCA
jgi:hypothetical protein